ncbi:MAG TPA: hypothetical protein VKE74_01465, partial [Gemmataceae bacterium]|nr:hypothetical protein [Gemmataceae bacterium]
MPLRLTCPGCQRVVSVPDDAVGKTLTCPGCRTPFVVPAVEPEPGVLQAGDEPRPSRDEEEDDRPRKRAVRDDEDDRPRRKPKKKTRAKCGPPWGLIAGIGGGLLAIAAVIVIVILVSKGGKGEGANDAGGGSGGGPGGGGGGGGAGILGGDLGPGRPTGPPPPGEMAGVIGAIEGLKPVILKPSADAPGIAFRLPVHEGYEIRFVTLPAQPSDYLTLVFHLRERFALPLATVVDCRTGRPIGKKFDLLPEWVRPPRPPFDLTPPDVSPDGALMSTHKSSLQEKWDSEPVLVWDVASGTQVKELRAPAATSWQGWVSLNRLLTVGKGAHLDSWSYPGMTRTEGASTGVKGPPDRLLPVIPAGRRD